jgi:hypothetical protein
MTASGTPDVPAAPSFPTLVPPSREPPAPRPPVPSVPLVPPVPGTYEQTPVVPPSVATHVVLTAAGQKRSPGRARRAREVGGGRVDGR